MGRIGWRQACAGTAILCLLAAPGLASLGADDQAPMDLRVPVRAVLSQVQVTPGDTVYLAVSYEIPPDAHIQKNEFFFIRPPEGEPFLLGEPVLPPEDTYEGEPVYRGRTTVFYAARLAGALAPGPRNLRLLAGSQACTEKPIFACFAPQEDTLSLQVEVVPPGSPTAEANRAAFASMSASPSPPTGEIALSVPAGVKGEAPAASAPAAGEGLAGRLQEALARRSFLAFLLVFLGGIATSFTPCVYPMIPITISYIGGRSRSRLGGLFLSVFFVLGIALTYSTLGVLAASTGALFGSAMQSTPVLLAVSAVFFAMGASMLGAFDLALPSGLQTRLQSGPRAGILGALFMGVVTGLVASPCVGPVVVVLLTWVAQIGSIPLGFLLLFVFALGLGVLFLLLGTFAGALSALPQAGGWMDTVKHIFGVILLAMGIYYLRSLLRPDLTWIISGAFVLLVGTFLGAFRPVGEEPSKSLLLRKGFGIIFLLVGGFVMLVGLARYADVPLGVMGEGQTGTPGAIGSPGLNWIPDDATGLAQARTEGRPALIDFYADWCAACKELDEKTWSDPEVRRDAARFVAIKLDLTRNNDWSKGKQEAYEIPGLPTVILFDSSGREARRFFGFRPAGEVLALMREIP